MGVRGREDQEGQGRERGTDRDEGAERDKERQAERRWRAAEGRSQRERREPGGSDGGEDKGDREGAPREPADVLSAKRHRRGISP